MSIGKEIAALRGKIGELKRQIAETELLAQADLTQLRQIMDPLEDDITRINTEQAIMVSQRLHETVAEIMTMKTKLSRYESELRG